MGPLQPGQFRVRLRRAVQGDAPWLVAGAGEHVGTMNRQGAVSILLADGSALGVKPGEFHLVDYPDLSEDWLDVPRVFAALERLRTDNEALQTENEALQTVVAAERDRLTEQALDEARAEVARLTKSVTNERLRAALAERDRLRGVIAPTEENAAALRPHLTSPSATGDFEISAANRDGVILAILADQQTRAGMDWRRPTEVERKATAFDSLRRTFWEFCDVDDGKTALACVGEFIGEWEHAESERQRREPAIAPPVRLPEPDTLDAHGLLRNRRYRGRLPAHIRLECGNGCGTTLAVWVCGRCHNDQDEVVRKASAFDEIMLLWGRIFGSLHEFIGKEGEHREDQSTRERSSHAKKSSQEAGEATPEGDGGELPAGAPSGQVESNHSASPAGEVSTATGVLHDGREVGAQAAGGPSRMPDMRAIVAALHPQSGRWVRATVVSLAGVIGAKCPDDLVGCVETEGREYWWITERQWQPLRVSEDGLHCLSGGVCINCGVSGDVAMKRLDCPAPWAPIDRPPWTPIWQVCPEAYNASPGAGKESSSDQPAQSAGGPGVGAPGPDAPEAPVPEPPIPTLKRRPATSQCIYDPWRTGRQVRRTIYDAHGSLIGLMDTPGLAAAVVEAVNRPAVPPRVLTMLRGAVLCGRDGFGHAGKRDCPGCKLLEEAEAMVRAIEGDR